MKRLWLSFICFSLIGACYAQNGINIETDIFGSITATTKGVKSKLEKNIFDDLVFTDSNNNQITYKEDFIKKVLQVSPSNKNLQRDIFYRLVLYLRDKQNFREVYEVDFFDRVKISNSQGDNITIDLDMVTNQDRSFWRKKYATQTAEAPLHGQIRQDALGNLTYRYHNSWAKLSKDTQDGWEYEDSNKNRVHYNSRARKQLTSVHQGEQNFFTELIVLFLEP